MSYFSWFESYLHKRTQIVTSLVEKGYDKEAIIDYFVFENMTLCEQDFCPLYKTKQKCHQVDYLNCYFCGCPHFYFDESGILSQKNVVIKSQCHINSKKAKVFVDAYHNVHLDCSLCHVPHTKTFVHRYIAL